MARFQQFSILFAILAIILVVLFYATIDENQIEGLDIIPHATDTNSKNIIYGYYQVDDSKMAMLPYGYKIDPNNPKKIIPTTQLAAQSLIPANGQYPHVPPKGDSLPSGFYLISDSSLAVLPPNMSPKVKEIDFILNPLMLQLYYDIGYVSKMQYYETKYTPKHYPPSLPHGVYYTDETRKTISLLPPEEIADKKKGYGKIPNPKLNLSAIEFNFATSNYRDISNNYDTQFHDDAKSIIKSNGMYDLEFGETRVRDQTGNLIILPKTNSQGNVTYYAPGEYPFGASKYVPNYEDSVYLSMVGNRTKIGNILYKND